MPVTYRFPAHRYDRRVLNVIVLKRNHLEGSFPGPRIDLAVPNVPTLVLGGAEGRTYGWEQKATSLRVISRITHSLSSVPYAIWWSGRPLKRRRSQKIFAFCDRAQRNVAI